MTTPSFTLPRRRLLQATLGLGGALAARALLPEIGQARAPTLIRAASARPQIPGGVASGDILPGQAVVWSQSDRPQPHDRRICHHRKHEKRAADRGAAALETSDFTAKLNLRGLPPDQEIFYRVQFQSLEDITVLSEPVLGRLRTPPKDKRNVSFLWSGDTAGQGWGINPEWGGMKIYAAMNKLQPDFFVHYTAAHYYDPNKAQFSDFNPFYEFVSGPLNAGTFGPNVLDNIFGPQVIFQKTPEPGTFNLPPSAGLQFFGQVAIDGASEVLTVTLRDLAGEALFTQAIEPVLA